MLYELHVSQSPHISNEKGGQKGLREPKDVPGWPVKLILQLKGVNFLDSTLASLKTIINEILTLI